jgi:anhydro-N-acetylmuramic acid kinase
MSGSSLDGLDIAIVDFTWINKFESIEFTDWQILQTKTIQLPELLINQLKKSPSLSGKDLQKLNASFGSYCGEQIKSFIMKTGKKIEGVGFHGHTVFHYPEEGFSYQLGLKEQIEKHLDVPVYTNFRNEDISRGGQGAPIVPIMEHYLLPEHQVFLNLGGIANISFHSDEHILAYDICPCNQLLNYVANQAGMDFDNNGKLARSGTIDKMLLQKMDAFDYYQEPIPKSLDNNRLQAHFYPLLDDFSIYPEDKLHTICKHIAGQINKAIKDTQKANVYCTGGGVHNEFLAECINEELRTNVSRLYIPDDLMVNYKEAVLMALLGFLRKMHFPLSNSDIN